MITVNADGTTRKWSYGGAEDEQFRPYGATDGSTFAFMKDDSFAVKDKSGKVIQTGKGSVSADGKTMTFHGLHYNPDGDVTTTSVYHKHK